MAIWHLGEGRHREKLGAAALSREEGSWGPSSWTLPFSYSHSPFPEGYRGNQCRAGPSLRTVGWALSLLGQGTGVGGVKAAPQAGGVWNATEQHDDSRDGESHEGRISSRETQGPPRSPAGREQPPVGEMRGSPGPTPVQRRRLEVVESGSLVCRSLCPSATQGGPWLPSALVPRPHGVRRGPPFQPPLSAWAAVRGPVEWALWSLKLGEEGWRVEGVGAPVPRLVGSG